MRQAGLPPTIGYTGHRWDKYMGPKGQYFAPYRYYNPATARWNMRDPLAYDDGLNMYTYVSGNPIIYADFLGLAKLSDCAKKILSPYFPDLDVDKINVKARIPIYIQLPNLGNVNGYKSPFILNKINIKKDKYNQKTTDGLSLIAHELKHVSQAKSEGLGKWFKNYMKETIKNGYSNNKYEKEAYALDSKVTNDLNNQYPGGNPCP